MDGALQLNVSAYTNDYEVGYALQDYNDSTTADIGSYSVGIARTEISVNTTYQIQHRVGATGPNSRGYIQAQGQDRSILVEAIIEKYAASHAIPTIVGTLVWS